MRKDQSWFVPGSFGVSHVSAIAEMLVLTSELIAGSWQRLEDRAGSSLDPGPLYSQLRIGAKSGRQFRRIGVEFWKFLGVTRVAGGGAPDAAEMGKALTL